jgi:predicted ferric reductase
MNTSKRTNGDSASSCFAILVTILGTAFGIGIAWALVPAAIPRLVATLSGTQPVAYWYLARSSAWVAYLLLWLAVMLGLMITSKSARIWPGGAAAFDLHQFTSLLGLAFALFHGLILSGDTYVASSIWQIIVPFAMDAYRPFWVGLGQMSIYGLAILCVSFYLRRLITPRGWRLLHFLGFLIFTGVWLHGVSSGTDSTSVTAEFIYLFTGGAVLLGTLYRMMVAAATPARHAMRT